MSETNQDQNSTLPDFDDELNDLLIRRYMLMRTRCQFESDDFSGDISEAALDSLDGELIAINKEIISYIRGEEENG